MIILIPYHTAGTGGPYTFVRAMAKHLVAQGHIVIHQAALSFDILLIIADCPLTLALYAKIRRRRIVQRLDGVYHPGLPGLKRYTYPFRNLRMQIIHNFLADHVIYQSKFARHSCQTMLGKREKNTSIIYNGVAAASSTPGVSPSTPGVFPAAATSAAANLVTFASFRRLDQIKPIIKSIKKLNTPYHLHIYGPHTKNLAELFSSLKNNPNITYHGALNHDKLLSVISQHDIFLFSDQSACPNTVLEALACSLPVVAFNRGSAPELVKHGHSGQVVSLAPHDQIKEYYRFSDNNHRAFALAITKVSKNILFYNNNAIASAQTQFSLDHMVRQYIHILLDS